MKSAIIGTALALTLAVPAQAVTYSVSGDWSDASNPDGPWSYGPGLAHFAPPSTPNSFNPAAANGYWGAGGDFFTAPFMAKVTQNGSATAPYGDNDFLAGDVVVHSPNDGSTVSINWTSPGAGTISVISSVWYAHSIVSRSQDAFAYFNNTLIGTAAVTNGIDRGAQAALFTGGLNVIAGDVISFRFAKSSGQQFGSLSGLRALIDFTPTGVDGVPEPASWAMMIAGFAVVGAATRRRRRVPVTAA